jgi:superfamily I DNA/RNA helicase
VKVVQSILEINNSHPSRKAWKTILPLLSGVGTVSKKTILNQLKENKYRYQALEDMIQNRYRTDLKKLLSLMQRLNSAQHQPVKTIKMTLKFLFGLKENIGGADVYSETLVAIARKSQDLEDLTMNLDDRSFGEYHTFKRHEGSGEFLTLANVHQIKGRGFEVVFYLGSYGTIFNKYHDLQNEDSRIDEIFVMHTAIARSCRHLYFMFPMTYQDWRNKVHENNPSTFIRKCPDHLYETFSIH